MDCFVDFFRSAAQVGPASFDSDSGQLRGEPCFAACPWSAKSVWLPLIATRDD